MGKKVNKASRKYAASGQLKKEIQSRKKHQQLKRQIERRKSSKGRGRDNDAENGGRAQEKRKRGGDEDEGDVMDGISDEEVSDEETGKCVCKST